MKKSAIVTGGTRNIVPAIGTLAVNLREICNEFADELVVFHNGISKRQQKIINTIFPTRFIYYDNPFSDTHDFPDVVTKYFSYLVFSKYECFRLLEEYSRVTWIDYDVVITKNFQIYFDRRTESVCAIPEINLESLSDMFVPDKTGLQLPSYATLNAPGYCLSFFSLTDKFPEYMSFYKNCLKMTVLMSRFLYLPEQCVVSVLMQNNKEQVHELPFNLFSCHPKDITENSSPFIIHAYSQPKFWNGLDNTLWNSYYKIWIDTYHGEKFKVDYKEAVQKYCLKSLRRAKRFFSRIVSLGN